MTQDPHSNTHTATNAQEKPEKVLVISDADALVLQQKLRLGQRLCTLSFAALLALLTLNYLLSDDMKFMHWLVAILPLAIFIPGLINPHHRTYSWLCFVLLMYFLFLVPLLMSYWSLTYWLMTILVTVLFITAMMTSRWLQYWNYYLSSKQ